MRVLFYRYGNICEDDLLQHFKLIGLDVTEITDEISKKGLTEADRVALLSSFLNSNSFLFVFSINFFPAISDLCQIYNTLYVGWTVDAPILELHRNSIMNSCNRVFCFDKQQYNEIVNLNPKNIFHLPLATNVARWDEVISGISNEDKKKFSCDVSFVGNLYSEKDPILSLSKVSEYIKGYIDGITECQTKIQGCNISKKCITTELNDTMKSLLPDFYPDWAPYVRNMDSFITCHSILDVHCSSTERISYLKDLSQHFNVDLYTRSNCDCFSETNINVHGGVSTFVEMPKVFNLSKINLNMTLHSIETGIPLRCFDIMGCGGFLLSNYQEELLDYFIPGEDFDYFTDSDDLIEKCGFYLNHESIRVKIAERGYEKVKNYHSYINRIPSIISKLYLE